MFLTDWAEKTVDMAKRHPGATAGLFSAFYVFLGLVYQSAFFEPLGVPILHLSAPPDFLLPGLRHSFVISLIVVLVMMLTILALLLLSCFTIFLLNLPGLIWKCFIWVLLYLCKIPVLLLYGLSFLLLCLLYMPFFCLYWLLFCNRSQENGKSLNDEYKSKTEMLKQFRAILNKSLDEIIKSVKDEISRLKKRPGDHWSKMDEVLSTPWMFSLFILVSILAVKYVTEVKAYQASNFIAGHDEEFQNNTLTQLTGVLGLDKTPIAAPAVQVRFRAGKHGPQNLLQVGGTTDFLLFWDDKQSTDVCAEQPDDTNTGARKEMPKGKSGEILIAPKSNILLIQPTGTNGKPSGEHPCKPGSADVVQAIDRLNKSLTRELAKLSETCTQCPDNDYSGVTNELQEIKTTFESLRRMMENRFGQK